MQTASIELWSSFVVFFILWILSQSSLKAHVWFNAPNSFLTGNVTYPCHVPINLVVVIAMSTLSFIDKKLFNMNVQAEINQNFQYIRRAHSGWECELRSNFPSPRGEEKYEQQAKCPHVLYVKLFNKVFIIPVFRHFLAFWLLPAVTDYHINFRFSHDVTSAMLVPLNKEKAAMLVPRPNPPGI